MKVEIFLVTYAPDAHWLEWSLKSIKRFASGFSGTTVLAPIKDANVIRPICERHGALLVLDQRAESPLGFLDHMVKKCYADQYCPGADFVFHTDSDVMFIELASPETFFKDGKPIMLVEPYAHLKRTKNPAACWYESTRSILKWEPPYETMRRHGAVYPRDVYGKFRSYIEQTYQKPFRTFMLAQHPSPPLGWSEFNCLGSYAQRFMPQQFTTIDVSRSPWPTHPLIQFWSQGPIDKPVDIWIKGKLCRVVPIEELRKIMPD
jgi:hypothetical protein